MTIRRALAKSTLRRVAPRVSLPSRSASASPPPPSRPTGAIHVAGAPSSSDAADVIRSMIDSEAIERTPLNVPPPPPPRLSLTDDLSDAARLGAGSVLSGPGSSDAIVAESRSRFEELVARSLPSGRITVPEPEDRAPISDDSVPEFTFPTESSATISRIRNFEAGGESFVGPELEPAEKPRILASLATEISRGEPRKNVLFIKKFLSKRGAMEKYTVLRKKIFGETTFVEISSSTTDAIEVPLIYNYILAQLPYPKEQIFVFEDTNIDKDNVYIYKIKVKWNELTASDIRAAAFRLAGAGQWGVGSVL